MPERRRHYFEGLLADLKASRRDLRDLIVMGLRSHPHEKAVIEEMEQAARGEERFRLRVLIEAVEKFRARILATGARQRQRPPQGREFKD
jgi:hypothetical protein